MSAKDNTILTEGPNVSLTRSVGKPTTTFVAAGQIDRQIEGSFRHLRRNRIKKSVLDQFELFLTAPGTLSRPSLIIRCQITDQHFNIRIVMDKPVSPRGRLTRLFVPFLKRVLYLTRGSADFFVLISDNMYVDEKSKAECIDFLKRIPFLRCDRRDDDGVSAHAIIIPDFYVLDGGYSQELNLVRKASHATQFDERQEVIKWRGSLRGPDYPNLDNCQDFPRYRLLLMSLLHPEVIDARLTTYENLLDSESAAALRRKLRDMFGEPAKFMPFETFVAFKYLISIDGPVTTWKRVPLILASGSVLLFQHRWNQFFYPWLKAWVHYVPLKEDISDLIERFEWLKGHPVQAKTIGENGQRFADEVLKPDVLEAYFVKVANQCSDLYDG